MAVGSKDGWFSVLDQTGSQGWTVILYKDPQPPGFVETPVQSGTLGSGHLVPEAVGKALRDGHCSARHKLDICSPGTTAKAYVNHRSWTSVP